MHEFNKKDKFHFIAIGGIGMSGLAKYLLELGFEVSGSDISDSKYLDKLKKLGAKVFIGHDETNLPDNAIVVASTAIKEDNPELKKAKKSGLKILHRSDLLKIISEGLGQSTPSYFIGFSGTHGKTTTSGLCAYVLERAGLKPSFVAGGIIPEINTNARYADGRDFIAELDESDGTILKYSPDIAVINNLEVDHVDFYTDGLKSIFETFDTFLANLKKDAVVLVNSDCKNNLALIERNKSANIRTFGIQSGEFRAKEISYSPLKTAYKACLNDEFLCDIELSVPGEHNVYNSLAVLASLYLAGYDLTRISAYFKGFTGMGRRYQKAAEFNGIVVIDDYAHHPSEVKTTLKCAKACNPDNRVVAVFQPHRYSRFSGLYDEFLQAFSSVDNLIVLDVYAAGEEPLDEHNSADFSAEVSGVDAVYIEGSVCEAAPKILEKLKSGDVVITLGAGDVTKLGAELEKLYQAKIGV